MNISLYDISVWVLPLVIAITFHEAAHAFVAYRLGDNTAWQLGRVSFNPLKHIDPFGTVILPGLLLLSHSPFLFGYAKPVPVNFFNLRNPKRDMIWVALAGPVTNLLLALIAVLFLRFSVPAVAAAVGGSESSHWVNLFEPVALMARNAVLINIVLAVFNAFPVPPLDGGRVMVGLLPEPQSSQFARIERFGFLIVLLLLMTHTLDRVIGPPVDFLINLYFGLLR